MFSSHPSILSVRSDVQYVPASEKAVNVLSQNSVEEISPDVD